MFIKFKILKKLEALNIVINKLSYITERYAGRIQDWTVAEEPLQRLFTGTIQDRRSLRLQFELRSYQSFSSAGVGSPVLTGRRSKLERRP